MQANAPESTPTKERRGRGPQGPRPLHLFDVPRPSGQPAVAPGGGRGHRFTNPGSLD